MASTRAATRADAAQPKAQGEVLHKTPGVSGGSACILDTRITVWGLVNLHRLGVPDEEILERVAELTPEDLRAAWDYCECHQEEIDSTIRRNEAA